MRNRNRFSNIFAILLRVLLQNEESQQIQQLFRRFVAGFVANRQFLAFAIVLTTVCAATTIGCIMTHANPGTIIGCGTAEAIGIVSVWDEYKKRRVEEAETQKA